MLLSPVSWSQVPTFRVLASEGDNTIATVEGGKRMKINPGDVLELNQELITGNNGYVGLVHESGQTIELTEPGKYQSNELHQEALSQENIAKWNLLNLWDVVYESLDQAQNNPELALGLENQPSGINADKLQVIGVNPKKLNPIYNDVVEMRWVGNSPKKNSRYIVNVMNIYDEVIISEMVSEPTFTLNLSDERILKANQASGNQVITFIVFSADNQSLQSWRYGLIKIDGPNAEKVKTEVQFFEDSVHPKTTLDWFIIATYYEKRGLYLDALTIYEGLVQSKPEVNEFKALYNIFISRNLKKGHVRG